MDGTTPAEEGADEKHFNELAKSHRKVNKPAALEESKKVEDVDD